MNLATPAQAVSMTFHHLGVAVPSIDSALAVYRDLFGFRQVGEPIDVECESVRVCLVEAPPGVLIELVEGVGDPSPIDEILARSGAGPYHVCYRVDDLDTTIRALRRAGCLPFKRFEKAAHGMRRFAFLLSPDRQLFELCEPDRGPAAEAVP